MSVCPGAVRELTWPILKPPSVVVPAPVVVAEADAVPGAERLLEPPKLNLPWVVLVFVAATEAVPEVDMVLVEPKVTGVKPVPPVLAEPKFEEPKDELPM